MNNERLENLKKRLLKNPEFKKAYLKRDSAFEIGQRIFEARMRVGWSQEKLAKKIGTQQPSIARLESGAVIQSIPMLEKIADALGIELGLPEFSHKTKTVFYPQTTVSQLLERGGFENFTLKNDTENNKALTIK